VGTMLMMPQVIKSFKTKKVDDISFASVILYVVNCALWLTYGILISAMPVVVTNFIALIIGIVQLVLRHKHATKI